MERLLFRNKLILLLVVIGSAVHTGLSQEQPAAVNLNSRCAEKLVSYVDWPKVKNPNFLLDLNAAHGRLYYFGAEHSADPAHAQFAEIEKAWSLVKPTISFMKVRIGRSPRPQKKLLSRLANPAL